MRVFQLIVGLLLVMLLSAQVLASQDAWQEKVHKDIVQEIEKSKINKSGLGIYIADGDSDKPLYALNSEKKMIPASITKIVTAAATLFHFPPGTKFKTQLLSKAKVEDGKLKGDLYLKGGGDPSFVSESMWFLVNAFLRNRISEVDGDIVVDDTLFDGKRFDQSRQKERVDRAYDAPTGAMSFNWNSVNVFVRPAAQEGEPAQIFVDPENEYTKLRGSVKTVKAGGKTEVAVDRDEDRKNGGGDVLVVSGKIAKDSKELVIYKNITQPDIWSGYNLKSFLAQRGVKVRGKIRSGTSDGGAALLAESESKPVEHILADMNKFSNNYVAEMLTKNIAAKKQQPASLATGMDMIRDYLTGLGVSKKEYELYNPSGLTRDNEMSAKALFQVLHQMKDQFQYQPEFVTSLPIAGVDGTLKKRLKDTPGERWVRAKTGFLTGVVSLAGFAGRKDGSVYSFVMMYNGSSDENQVRALYDRLCLLIVK